MDYKKIALMFTASFKNILAELQKEDVETPIESVEAKTETEPIVEKPAEVELVESVPVETMKADSMKTLAELIPVDVDGYFRIGVQVIEGKIVCGTICAETHKELELSKQANEDFETKLSAQKTEYETKLTAQKADFEAKIIELGKESGKNPVIQAPTNISNEAPVKLSKIEYIKKQILNN